MDTNDTNSAEVMETDSPVLNSPAVNSPIVAHSPLQSPSAGAMNSIPASPQTNHVSSGELFTGFSNINLWKEFAY